VQPSSQTLTESRGFDITQPDGPSFTLDGHEVRWQKWHLIIGYSPREGLVLHRPAAAVRPPWNREDQRSQAEYLRQRRGERGEQRRGREVPAVATEAVAA
jgi:hypothetical protein